MKTGTYHHTQETLDKIRESNRTRIVSEASRLKMSQSGKGKHARWGDKNPMWNGGHKINQDGYTMVRLSPDDPFYPLIGKNGYIMEHRLVMARHLGRALQTWEIVHHKNGVRDDNRIENLALLVRGDHLSSHSKGYRDGFQEGLFDGKDTRIKELQERVRLLESRITLLEAERVMSNV